jgi:SAM-dependent methyltransferase
MSDPLQLVRDQFTRQAAAFAAAPAMRNDDALRLLVALARTTKDDAVLDVGCGPGLVACAFAATAERVTGIDLTPAMIERARALQTEKQLNNVTWQIGDVSPLPFASGSFSIVVCRYALHHFQNPPAVVREMTRVCRPGGRLVIADVTASADPAIAAAFNQMERLRDPSHVRALSLTELRTLGSLAGLTSVDEAYYQLEVDLDRVLGASFPHAGDAERVRAMFTASLETDRLGVNPRQDGAGIRFGYPIALLVWQVG